MILCKCNYTCPPV